MLLKYFYDRRLAQASYMVGCAATGEALIIDPMRDITPYLKAAADEGLKIAHVTETHIHADFVSGSRELAAATGARLYVSDMGGPDWQYAFAGERGVIPVRDGDAWMVGNIRIEVVHTPGHTPEHISFLITDTAAADRPIGMFTGDFLFVGDVGRPDLLEEAAGYVGTKETGARQQFRSVQRVRALPDYLQIWPGHGAGSACGKALGAIPSTTLGYEKLFNPAFQHTDEQAFIDWLLDGQPEPPRYFAQMKRVNREGPALLDTLAQPVQADRAALDAALRDGALVIDLRDRQAFAAAHVPGTLNIPADDTGFVTYAGWFVEYDAPLYFITPTAERAPAILDGLRSIGIDDVPAWFTADVVTGATESLPLIDAPTLAQRLPQNGLVILDVRGHTEHQQRHIAGARNIPLGYLPRYLDQLPRDHAIVTHCASGFRSQIAASLLRRHGFDQVMNLDAGIDTWSAAFATEQG